jgi:DNA-binding transcriptional MerR regulator
MKPEDGMRLDDLAREAGVATTTVRLYQNRGLLPGPRLVGRTGYYDQRHLTRLRLIARLQEQGFSLAGIARLLATWETGRDLGDLVGLEEQLDMLLHRTRAVVIDASELAARMPADALTPELLGRAESLGLVEPTDDGRFRIPDQRFLDVGGTLVELGVPVDVILDEWARLAKITDEVAARFVAVFEDHVLPGDWAGDVDDPRTSELATSLARLRHAATQVLTASLDASITRLAHHRLTTLTPTTPAE